MKLKYRDLTQIQKNIIKSKGIGNGCGGKGSKFNPPDFFFTTSCDWHDLSYYRGGTEFDRGSSDVGFYDAMLNDVTENKLKKNFLQRFIYRTIATFYYCVIRIFGKKYFTYRETKLTLEEILN